MSSPLIDAIRPYRWFYDYTSFGSAIDLTSNASGPNDGEPARYLKVVAGSGTITVKMGISATSITLTVAAGEELKGYFRTVESVTGVTSLRAGW